MTMNLTLSSATTSAPSGWFRLFLIMIFLMILSIGLIGNLLVLLSVITNHIKVRRSSTNLLLVNMSCADLLILIFNIFDIAQFSFDHFWPTAWYLGLFLCKIVRFAQVFGCYVSVQTLLVISIERYISIIHPIKLSHINRRKRLRLIFILIWSAGFIVASPNLYLLKLHALHDRPASFVCGLSDHLADSHLIQFYKYTELIFFFFLPALIQTILYLIICRQIFWIDRVVQAHSHAVRLQESRFSDSHQQYSDMKPSSVRRLSPGNNRTSLSPMISPVHALTVTSSQGNIVRKKAIIMLLIVTILYFVAFSPTQINYLYTQLTHSHHLYDHRLFFFITILLVLSSTAFNPILFYIFSKFFRCKFNSLLSRACPSSIRQTRKLPNI